MKHSLLGHFYENRPFIENEYEQAQWEGECSVETIDHMMRQHVEDHPDRPWPIVIAECLRILLENAPLDMNEHTMFPDKIGHGARYTTVASGGIFEKITVERYLHVFETKCPAVWHHRAVASDLGIAIPDTDVWHVSPDWKAVLSYGISGLLERARNARITDEESGIFYESVIIAYEGILAYMNRLHQTAVRKGLKEYAACLEVLLKRPPETLYQAMALQHIFLTVGELGHERYRTYGPVDEMWLPYYVHDLETGELTQDETKEMLRYFLEKIAAEKRSADQPICIGKAYGEDSSRGAEFIMMILDTYEELKNHNPKIHLLCPKDVSDTLLSRVMRMIRNGISSIVLVNDEAVYRGYERIGVGRDISKSYIPLGCYECIIMGYEDARICGSWINMAKAVEYAVTGGYDYLGRTRFGIETDKSPASWEDFLKNVYLYLAYFADFVKNNLNEQSPYAYDANPSPVLSGTIDSCMEKGRDVYHGGMRMNNQSIKCFAVGTAVDSLLMVKKYVYDLHEITLPQLADILRTNWENAPELRQRVLCDTVKWGNGIPEADRLAQDLFEFMGSQIIGVPTASGGVFRMGADSVDMAENYGRHTGATPDGRLAGEPLSKNMRPVNGMERNGVTGLIRSVASVDGSLFIDGAPLDFMLHPSAVTGEKGIADMVTLVHAFMDAGGMCMHGNVIDIDTLRDAQAHPEKYPKLQVRVCGWNEYFIRMRKAFQDDFIQRASSLQ